MASRINSQRHRSRFVAFVLARLSPEGYLGLHLTLGACVLILATWIFAHIAEGVWNREHLTIIDAQLSTWLHAHSRYGLTLVMLAVSYTHGQVPITIITLVLSYYLFRKRYWRWLWAINLTVFGGMLLNVILKDIFHRARPQFTDPIVSLSSYAFPSGHTMTATCFYGVLAAFFVRKVKSWTGRVLVIAVAAFMVLLVAFSRVYLGAHYLSDVLGAMAEGLAWLAFCVTGVSVLRRRRD